MVRTFFEHNLRHNESLDGLWDFAIADKDGVPSSFERKVLVPCAWETLPNLEAYRGKAWFRRTFELSQPSSIRIVFGGISHTGRVHVDGKFVGTHYDAFTPWEVVVPGLSSGKHELAVWVDNTFGEHSALHTENDYYTYGGITRPVELQIVPDVYVDRMYAKPLLREDVWSLELQVTLAHTGKADCERSVRASVAGKTLQLGEVTVPAGGAAEIQGTFPMEEVSEWTAETPTLYPLVVELLDGTNIVDDKIDRIGFRHVELQGKKFLLNGKSIRLRGYNRHEDHPLFGNAIPLEAMMTDLQIMADLGCNFVRTCHYPNDMRFLDLCDELGFYVWEESHARGISFEMPLFDEQIATSTREMLQWHYNHPCIVIWGCLNECDAQSERGQEVYSRVLKQIKAFDDSRPNTYASHHRKKDKCCKHADILSLNIYTGWYVDPIERMQEVIDDLLGWIHSDESAGGEGKPVIMSEFGAGAILGNRQRCRSHWSEEYQADVLDECLRVYLNHADIMGAAIWQFCDCRVTKERWRSRPRTTNNKGTVDEYRRPKLVYEVVKRRMLEAKKRWDSVE